MASAVQKEQVAEAISALKEFFAKESAEQMSKCLFTETYVKLYFNLKKLPVNNPKRTIEITLPNGFLDKVTTSICLITKDLDKRKKRDTETCVNHFRSILLDNKNVDCINEVISFKQLKIEYRTFEARRKLCSAYDVFLVDDRIADLVAPYLSRTFLEANKFPFAVKLTRGNLNNRIEKCLRTARLNINQLSTRCCVRFGHVDQSADELLQNFEAVIKSVDKHLPGSFNNVRSVDINVGDCPMLPVYVSTESANAVRLPVPKAKSESLKPVTDVFDSFETSDGSETKIRVWPSGQIQLIKSNATDEKETRSSTKRKLRNLWTRGSRASKKIKLSKQKKQKLGSNKSKVVKTEDLSEIKKEAKQERPENNVALKIET